MKKKLFWALTAATTATYGTIVLWSLPTIATEAAGLTPFDMRPGGYTYEDAFAFLSVLSAEGRLHYTTVQHMLDWLYPPLMSATLLFAIWAMLPKRLGHLRWIVALSALPSTVFDYAENAAIGQVLGARPDVLDPALVEHASAMTVLKSQSTTLAITLTLALLLVHGAAWARQALRSSRQQGVRQEG